MPQIHPMSVIDPKAEIAKDAIIGPFCVIGPDVTIGSGTILMSHVNVAGVTTIGARNKIYANASIGCDPQDKKYAGEKTRLTIGDDNVIRENVTIATGTVQDEGITSIGSRNLIMANVHVAHDCRLGNDIIVSVGTGFAGHCRVDDFAVIGGMSGFHQFCRIGKRAMVGGGSACVMDVPPFLIANGAPTEPHGLNIVGLRRAGYDSEALNVLKHVYHIVYREGLTIAQAIEALQALSQKETAQAADILAFANFLATSERGIIRPKG
ncbi:MAG TPA: acyl-[acyl-carrier-protein]--UDP-N-acetylglucosamine O-acyltransferase [Sutterella sp.]|nr:acyl-[acyl-carrier-protein]--UDP-N-acetylglucosamine O-acyltransferase [Sutterella sp.]